MFQIQLDLYRAKVLSGYIVNYYEKNDGVKLLGYRLYIWRTFLFPWWRRGSERPPKQSRRPDSDRKGKGTHLAIRKAQTFCRRYNYFLKLDVHKFFDSVDHETLKAILRRKIKDLDMLQLLDVFVNHAVPCTEPGKQTLFF